MLNSFPYLFVIEILGNKTRNIYLKNGNDFRRDVSK